MPTASQGRVRRGSLGSPSGLTARSRLIARSALATIAAAFALAACVLPATPASAATILLITPSSIEAGFAITVSATCGDNVNPAVVTSRVFGTVTLVPDKGKLHTSITVPANTRAGTYNVDLSCASGQTATSNFAVIHRATPANTLNPTFGPATGGGEMAASTGARIAIFGGLGAVVVGIAVWIVSAVRRRPTIGG
jgi:hypothetical protein